MLIEEMLGLFKEYSHKTAIVYNNKNYSYDWLYVRICELSNEFSKTIKEGSVVQLIADFSPNAIALFFALAFNKAIISPLTQPTEKKRSKYEKIVNSEYIIRVNSSEEIIDNSLNNSAHHPHITELRNRGSSGLIILSSGSSGKSKAIVHDMKKLFNSFKGQGKSFSTIAFLLFDHIGGLNTLFQTLSSGGSLVIPSARTPVAICKVVEEHQVTALVTSPSFLNLLILSQLADKYDLSSLKVINYGSEPMSEFLLKKLTKIFPHIRFSQSYGMSEIGVVKVRSKSSSSLYMSIDSSTPIRIRDGLLEIKAKTSMLGYINAPSPFTQDGWLITGDRVEVKGDYIKILGRDSEIINVGGEKVYPAEVESVLLEISGIEDAVVVAEKNMLLGNIVLAKVKLKDNADIQGIRKMIRSHCSSRLDKFKIPQKIEVIDHYTHNERHKKIRRKVV